MLPERGWDALRLRLGCCKKKVGMLQDRGWDAVR